MKWYDTKKYVIGVTTMLNLLKPNRLQKGDKVATVSLSWGGAGDESLRWRYELGKRRLQDEFGLEVVEMPNTLRGSEYLYTYPEKRAQDLMNAFQDKSIKAIFSCIGGDESVRLIPHIDFEVIRNSPKIFLGYSDTTVSHFMCLKAGVSSFYGASILAEFAENVEIFDYTKDYIQNTLFTNEIIGNVPCSPVWTAEYIEWREENKNKRKQMHTNQGYELLQGKGIVQGRLIGGCIEVLEMIKSTKLWNKDDFKDSILFLETSEDTPEPSYVEYWLRNYGSQGILQNLKGIAWGKPYQEKYYEEYKAVIKKVVSDELKLVDLPILYNMSFGHNEPMICLPYGAMAEIDCNHASFSILESGVI